ncbi:hypothetical protein HPG69_016818 [Diceros bicornis minor]|uniref:Uncharacterized protein n=2 Tax=Rhinocerotidae TaxID=9803 RepID=A0A7J7EBZ4_DICBM|nr:hypothetical protein HPG69_016818 [Diceros bicornis minor]
MSAVSVPSLSAHEAVPDTFSLASRTVFAGPLPGTTTPRMHQAEKLANQEAQSRFPCLLVPLNGQNFVSTSVPVDWMFNVSEHKQNVEAMIKNINTISLELKKMKELSQLLLCDLTLHFSHPVKIDDLKETERNNPPFEESKISDVSLASNSFSL